MEYREMEDGVEHVVVRVQGIEISFVDEFC